MTAALSHNATLVLQGQFAAGAAIEQIERHRCTAIYTLPNITRAIIQHPDFDKRRTLSLRTGLTIGTADDVRLAAEALAAPAICNVYGLTETYGNCCVTWSDAPLEERTTGQGPPLPGFKLRIVDPESRAPLAPGSAGEVEVCGYISPGYSGESGNLYNNSMRTADQYFRTGDVGYLNSKNILHFVGRNNEMIKTGGINVSPAEVELTLQRHPAIAEAAVVGVASIERGEDVVAFVVRKTEHLSKDELDEYCRSRMSAYKAPRHFVFVEALPTTGTGKISRKELVLKWANEHASITEQVGTQSARDGTRML